MTKQFSVTGMTCAACSAHVERAAGQVPGVQEAAVNLMLGRLHVTYDESVTSPQAIIDAVIRSGYGAREADEADLGPDKQQECAAWDRDFCGLRFAWCPCFISAWAT